MNNSFLKFIASSIYGFIDIIYLSCIVRKGYDNIHIHKVNNHKKKLNNGIIVQHTHDRH